MASCRANGRFSASRCQVRIHGATNVSESDGGSAGLVTACTALDGHLLLTTHSSRMGGVNGCACAPQSRQGTISRTMGAALSRGRQGRPGSRSAIQAPAQAPLDRGGAAREARCPGAQAARSTTSATRRRPRWRTQRTRLSCTEASALPQLEQAGGGGSPLRSIQASERGRSRSPRAHPSHAHGCRRYSCRACNPMNRQLYPAVPSACRASPEAG